ncbi:MAG: TetR/AcrR family transcriptional regulator [Mycobacteriales bacterium]
MSTEVVKPAALAPRHRRTRAQSRDDNRRALIDSARALIVEVGYAAAGLDQIADRAGLTKGAIYSLFGGKLELLRAVLDEHYADALSIYPAVDAAGPGQSAEDVLELLARSYVGAVERPHAWTLLAFELELFSLALRDPPTLEQLLARHAEITRRLTAILTGRNRRGAQSPLSAGEASRAAHLVLGSLVGLGQRAVVIPGSPRDAHRFSAVLIRLLDAASDEPPPTDE